MHISESYGIGKACSSCAHNVGIHFQMHVLELWSCQLIVVRLPIETDQEYSIKFTIIATSHMIHFCRLGTFWFSSTYYHELTQLWLLSSGVEVDENRHVVAGSHDCSAHFAILIWTAAMLHHSTCQKSNPEFFVHRNERKYMLYFSASVVCPKAAYLLAYCLKKSETEYPGWYTNQHGCRIHKRIQYTFIMLSSQKFKKIVPLPAGFEPLTDGKISSMSALTSRATMSYTEWDFILYYLPMFQFQEKRLKWILLHHHFYRRSDDSM